MPRTKQVRKKSSILKKQKKSTALSQSISSTLSSYSTENDKLMNLVTREYETEEEFIEEFDKFYNDMINTLTQSYEDAVKKMGETIRSGLPQLLRSKNIIADSTEEIADQNKDPNVDLPRVRPSRSRTPVDLFQFKRPKTPHMSGSVQPSRKRSASASAASSASSNRNVFKTPLMSSIRPPLNTVITPKISNTPISLLRRPQHGEVAVSMSGSPLMVGPLTNEDMPTVNVPLSDGRVFSIIPERGAHPPDLPQLDEITKEHLKTLRAHLKIMAPDTP